MLIFARYISNISVRALAKGREEKRKEVQSRSEHKAGGLVSFVNGDIYHNFFEQSSQLVHGEVTSDACLNI